MMGSPVASKSLNFGALPSSYTPLDMDPLPWTNPQGAGGHSMSVLSEAEGLFGVAEHNSGTNKELMGRTATSMLGVTAEVQVPDMREDQRASQHFAAAAHEKLQQHERLGWEITLRSPRVARRRSRSSDKSAICSAVGPSRPGSMM